MRQHTQPTTLGMNSMTPDILKKHADEALSLKMSVVVSFVVELVAGYA